MKWGVGNKLQFTIKSSGGSLPSSSTSVSDLVIPLVKGKEDLTGTVRMEPEGEIGICPMVDKVIGYRDDDGNDVDMEGGVLGGS